MRCLLFFGLFVCVSACVCVCRKTQKSAGLIPFRLTLAEILYCPRVIIMYTVFSEEINFKPRHTVYDASTMWLQHGYKTTVGWALEGFNLTL